jgi:hypothetical protein
VAAAKPGSSAVTAMQIFVDRVKVKQVSGSKIDAYVTMSSGWHRLTVQAVDSSGSFKWTEGVAVP